MAGAALPRVLVLLPARDEADSVGEVVARVRAVGAAQAAALSLDVLVVDDGSADATGELARRAGALVVRHETNRGLGAAMRTALLQAWAGGYDAAVRLDADGQYAPEHIPALLAPILAGEADLVWGARRVYRYRMPFVRRVGNRLFSALLRRLTGWPIHDAQTGMMAFSRRFLDGFSLDADYNPPQLLLLDGARRGLRYAERPIEAEPRRTGRSFVSWRYPLRVGANIARFYLFGGRSPPRSR